MAAGTFLIGGGWDAETNNAHYGAFLERAGPEPVIACLVVDEGHGHGDREATRFAAALGSAGTCTTWPVLVPQDEVLDPSRLDGADARMGCAGLTPAYADALQPVARELQEWLRDRPYCGFSAGAAVAATRAVVGGWLHHGAPVCPEDSAEELDEVSVVDGLGLVPYAVDVHCAQWGTLPRLLVAVAQEPRDAADRRVVGVGLDEGTLICVGEGTSWVSGTGHAWVVRADGTVTAVGSGGRF